MFAESVTIHAPKQAHAVSLLHPKDGQLLAARRRMHLWVIINNNTGKPVDNAKCSWFIDGKEVAQGRDAWITAPASGMRICALKVDVDGNIYERAVEFKTILLHGKRG